MEDQKLVMKVMTPEEIARERSVYKYVEAMDSGRIEETYDVWRAAMEDSELARILHEVDKAYVEELELFDETIET